MKNFNLDKVLYIIIAIALLTAGYFGVTRIIAERHNNIVEIVADYDGIKSLSSLTGKPLNQILSIFSKSGVKSLAVKEDTIGSLEQDGMLTSYSGSEVISRFQANQSNSFIQQLVNSTRINPYNTYLLINDTYTFDRVRASFFRELGESNIKAIGTNILELNGMENDLNKIGVGFSASNMKILNDYGFAVVPRLLNSSRLDDNNIALKLNNLSDNGKYFTVIFDQDSVLGFPRNIRAVAQKLNTIELNFGIVEFAKQRGDIQLALAIPDRTIRVHSIPVNVLAKMDPDTAIDRYLRACQERGARMLYVRPWLNFEMDSDLLRLNQEYIKTLTRKLNSKGYHIAVIKQTRLHLDPPLSVAVIILMLGQLAALLLILKQVIKISIPRGLYLSVGALAVVLISLALPDPLSRKFVAMLSASLFPGLLILAIFRNQSLALVKFNNIYKHIIYQTGLLALCSLLVGLVISAMLGETRFMLSIQQFAGIKLAFITPLVLTGGYLMFEASHLQGFIFKVRRIINSNVSVSTILIMGAIIASVAMLILRSGNSAPELLAPGEAHLRNILEKIMFVRPRFKEFLIGYPALVLFYWFCKEKIGSGPGWLLVIGTMASISVVNSFCHLHTPLLYSILRTLNGWVFGLIVGFIAVFICEMLLKVSKRIFQD